MEVIDKERKNALLSIYSGYEPQPEPQQNYSPNRNHNHQFQTMNTQIRIRVRVRVRVRSYLDRASLKQFGDFQDYKKQYTVHFVYT
jgi:hypothetical protein